MPGTCPEVVAAGVVVAAVCPKAAAVRMRPANDQKIRVCFIPVPLLNSFGGGAHMPSPVVPASSACISMRREVIPYHLAVLHHESNALQLGNVGDRISSNGDEIGKLSGLNRAHAVLPA